MVKNTAQTALQMLESFGITHPMTIKVHHLIMRQIPSQTVDMKEGSTVTHQMMNITSLTQMRIGQVTKVWLNLREMN